MAIFYTMMNLAGINSLIDLHPLRKTLFLKTLALELTVAELKKRSLKKVGISSSLQVRLKRFCPICDDGDGGKSSLSRPKRHRCMACAVDTGIRRLNKIK